MVSAKPNHLAMSLNEEGPGTGRGHDKEFDVPKRDVGHW